MQRTQEFALTINFTKKGSSYHYLKMFMHNMVAEERRSGFMAVKLIIKKLQTHLRLSYSRRAKASRLKIDGGVRATELLPDDVKEGQFAVFAVNSETPQRFVVGLRFLSNPSFLKLLKQAEEEYGFKQEGVLAVPCQPDELQKILQQKIGCNAYVADCNASLHKKEKHEV